MSKHTAEENTQCRDGHRPARSSLYSSAFCKNVQTPRFPCKVSARKRKIKEINERNQRTRAKRPAPPSCGRPKRGGACAARKNGQRRGLPVRPCLYSVSSSFYPVSPFLHFVNPRLYSVTPRIYPFIPRICPDSPHLYPVNPCFNKCRQRVNPPHPIPSDCFLSAERANTAFAVSEKRPQCGVLYTEMLTLHSNLNT